MHNAPSLPIRFHYKYDLLRHMFMQEVAAIGILDLTSNQKVHSSFISSVICRPDQGGLIKML